MALVFGLLPPKMLWLFSFVLPLNDGSPCLSGLKIHARGILTTDVGESSEEEKSLMERDSKAFKDGKD